MVLQSYNHNEPALMNLPNTIYISVRCDTFRSEVGLPDTAKENKQRTWKKQKTKTNRIITRSEYNMNKQRNKLYWKVCIACVGVIVVLGYTPLMLPEGKYQPMILGIPSTLAIGFLATVLLVVLTYIGAKVHPGSDGEEEEK